MAGWLATIANGLGSGYKRPLKPEKLWTPNLVEPKPPPKTTGPDAEAREAERRRKNREKAKRLDAGLPPVAPSKKR